MNDLTGPPIVDIEAMADLDFDRWETDATGWTPPTNEEWTSLANPHLISVRLAWLTLHKSKDELTEASGQLGDEALIDLVGQIGQSADWIEGLHKLLTSAETRIMCAYATLNAEAADRWLEFGGYTLPRVDRLAIGNDWLFIAAKSPRLQCVLQSFDIYRQTHPFWGNLSETRGR